MSQGLGSDESETALQVETATTAEVAQIYDSRFKIYDEGMNYKILGRTGLKVSELCLGTMTFGENYFNIAVVNQASANEMVARALSAGINFFDTADVYSYGESETVLGQSLKDTGPARDKVIIATKVRGAMSEGATAGTGDVNNVGLSRQHIFSSVEGSLRRLQTDYIDLYQVHGWDVLTPVEEALRALDDLVRQGKVRYIGCSNWAARQLMKALCLSESHDWAGFVSLQAYYSVAQVALAWLLAQPGVTSVIIGANKLTQLEDNLKAAALELSAAEIETLSATTAPRALYPEWMIERQNEGRR